MPSVMYDQIIHSTEINKLNLCMFHTFHSYTWHITQRLQDTAEGTSVVERYCTWHSLAGNIFYCLQHHTCPCMFLNQHCIMWHEDIWDKPFNADLGAMYRPLILLMLPSPVCHMVINTF